MNPFFANNKSTIFLLSGVILGGLFGVFFGSAASIVAPIGKIFLNLIFVIIIPLVMLSIASSVSRMSGTGSVGRAFLTVVLVFLGMSVCVAVLGYFSSLVYNPLGMVNRESLIDSLPPSTPSGKVSLGDSIVSALSVPDFVQLLSKDHILPLIIFSALLGWAIGSLGEKAQALSSLIDSGLAVVMKMMGLLMKFAPVGLGCYFAEVVSSFGTEFLAGYLRSFLLILVLSIVIFAVLHPLYLLLFCGVGGTKAYWAHIIPPSITAAATTSSAAAMPGNIEAAEKMGVSADIAESVIPLGTNIHKDGSVLSGVVKIMFLMSLFGDNMTTPAAALSIMAIAIVTAMVTGAVPGGACTGELLICILMGVDPSMVGLIIVIGTLVDPPATLINSSANVVAAVLTDRFTKKEIGICPRKQL